MNYDNKFLILIKDDRFPDQNNNYKVNGIQLGVRIFNGSTNVENIQNNSGCLVNKMYKIEMQFFYNY